MYLVLWTEIALQDLAAVWLASTNRNAVTDASSSIDLVLEVLPNSGEILFDNVREFVYPPLAVVYEVDDSTRMIQVVSVWDATKGRPPLVGN